MGISFFVSACSLQASTNMLRNPSFETQGSWEEQAYEWEWNWPYQQGGTWGTASRRNWRAVSGSWEGSICGTWAGSDNGGWWQELACVPAQRYRLSGFFHADGSGNKWTAGEQAMKIEFYTAETNYISQVDCHLQHIGPNWVRKEIEAAAPANAYLMQAIVYANSVGSYGALQFDDLSLASVDEASPEIFPGPSSRRTGLAISEIMYHPSDRADAKNLEYVEVFNSTPFTNQLTGWQLAGSVDYAFPTGAVLAPFSFLVVAKEPASVESVYGITQVYGPFTGSLPNSSGRVRLRNAQDAILLEVNYSDQPAWPVAADGAGHSLTLSQASYGEDNPLAWSPSIRPGGSPGGPEMPSGSLYPHVIVNEILAHTDPPQWDFVELFNTSTQAINLSGCMLSDQADTNLFFIPAGTTIPARGYQVYYANTNVSNPTNLPFNLSSKGEDLFFRAPDTTVVDCIRFGAQQNGMALGRFPDGASSFHELQTPSPAASNKALNIRSVVINELMYNPLSGEDDDEYVELHNTSGVSVDISRWRFTEGITFDFPNGTTLPAGGYLVVAKNAVRLLSNYPALSCANTLGGFGGGLANGGERIVLAKPDDPLLPEQDFVIVDEVTYQDGGRWGAWSDGGGSSLELTDPLSDNRQAANWADSDETAKSSWTWVQYTNTLDHGMTKDGAPIDELHLLMLGAGECLVDNVEAVRYGVNYVVNGTFESGLSGWTIQGNHVRSGLTNSGYAGSYSLRVRASGGGDTGANRIKTVLSSYFYPGNTGILRARARWLRGSPLLLLRLKGNYLEAEGSLPVPKNLGTPGQANSRRVTNAGPAIWDVAHSPILPAVGQPVTVTARVHDPNGINYVRVKFRLDPFTSTSTVAMAHIGGGVYRGVIPGQAEGQLAAFHIEARDAHASLVIARFPADASARECLVRWGDSAVTSELGTYRFWLTQANVDEWTNRERHSDQYLDATFVYGNERVIYNAAIRWRGSPFVRPSLLDPMDYESRGAYRVQFPDDDRLLGVDELNLDTLEQYKDATLQRERTCFMMAEQLGLPFSYQRYVFVYLNGIQHPFAYADTHHVESDYLSTWYPDRDGGELFKVDDWFEFNSFNANDFASENADLGVYATTGGLKKKARYRWCWENKSNQDYTHLFELVDAAHLPDAAYAGTLSALADMEQWMKVFAFRHVLGDWDGYGYNRGKNMLMYQPPAAKWQMLLWDLDFAIGSDTGTYPDADLFQVADYTPVVKRMIEYPPFRRMYWQTLLAAVQGPLLSARVQPMMNEVHRALLANGVAAWSPSISRDGFTNPQSWISQRRNYMVGQLSSMTNFNLAITSNGGGNFSTNRNAITLSGLAPIQAHSLAINGVVYELQWTSVTAWSVQLALTSGVNPIVVAGYDANGQAIPGMSDSMAITYTGADQAPEGQVVFSEIMYQPVPELAEFLELYNRSTNYAFNLMGYRLAGVDYIFEEGAVLGPTQFMVLVENRAGFAAAYSNAAAVAGEYSGKLDNGGERLRLMRTVSSNETIVDEVIFSPQPPWPSAAAGSGASLQLIDARRDRNRVGNWAADTNRLFTPGAANSTTSSLPEFPLLWLNEIQPNNLSGRQDRMGEREPWIELYNGAGTVQALTNYYLTDNYANLTRWAFTNGAVCSNGFLVVIADGEPGESSTNEPHASFRLSLTNGSLALVHSNAGRRIVVDYINHPRVAADRSYGSSPDGVWTNRGIFMTPSPGATNGPLLANRSIVINEWMADNAYTIKNEYNEWADWFELYNAGDEAVDLTGYTLTDKLSQPDKWTIPSNIVIGAQQYLMVWADSRNSTSNMHTSFALSKGGEALGFYTPDGVALDTIVFGAQTTDVSQGRWPDAHGAPFYYMKKPTPGSANLLSSNRFTLTVQTQRGTASPAAGQYTNFHGALLNADISDPSAAGGTQYVCRGWSMLGQEPRNGSGATLTMAVTNHAALTWLWDTNVWLETDCEGSGAVQSVEGWHRLGTTVVVTAEADIYYHFTNWTGELPPGSAQDNPLLLAMPSRRSVMAHFVPDLATNQTPVWWLAEHGLTNQAWDVEAELDQDGDRLWTWQEWLAGTDPTNRFSVLEALSPGQALSGGFIVRWSSVAGRTYRIMQSTNLAGTGFQLVTNQLSATPSVNVYTTGLGGAENRFIRIELDP
ncbi:MAG: hypothetical protein A2X46_04530 [Lentisphaerae bacterium GWF2_57_35]|nr:MAG: hypothetical protein A2X46_04530 [Lentisphaerae bacterium GWF2_57_35]